MRNILLLSVIALLITSCSNNTAQEQLLSKNDSTILGKWDYNSSYILIKYDNSIITLTYHHSFGYRNSHTGFYPCVALKNQAGYTVLRTIGHEEDAVLSDDRKTLYYDGSIFKRE